MELKKGDVVAVNVRRDWTESVHAGFLHYFPGDDTDTSRLFIAKIVSVSHTDGIWFESSRGDDELGQMILVQWTFILAIRTGLKLRAKRDKPGFIGEVLDKAKSVHEEPTTLAELISRLNV